MSRFSTGSVVVYKNNPAFLKILKQVILQEKQRKIDCLRVSVGFPMQEKIREGPTHIYSSLVRFMKSFFRNWDIRFFWKTLVEQVNTQLI